MFALLEIGERAGSGMGKILKTWSEEGYQEPTVEERFDKVERTTLRLPLKGDEAQNKANEAQNEAQMKPKKHWKTRLLNLFGKMTKSRKPRWRKNWAFPSQPSSERFGLPQPSATSARPKVADG